MSNNSPIAIGLGEVLWDLFPEGKQLGGAPANFAYHAQQLGAQSFVVSAVGRDVTGIGQELLARLRELGLDTSCVSIDAKHPTGTVSVNLDAAGVPTYVINSEVAWDYIRQSPALTALARRADVVCFGSLAQRSETSGNTIRHVLSEMRPESLRIFDINLRQNFFDASIVRASLEAANVLKLNDDELPKVIELLALPSNEPAAVAAMLSEFNLKLIALTRGAKGSSLFTPARTSHSPGISPAKTVDTVGAGDAFTAAVAMGLLLSRPLDEINAVANRLASYVCSQPGATPPVPAKFAFDAAGR